MKPKYTPVKGTEIMETNEYSVFKLDIKNRPLNSGKVSTFISAFKNGRFFMKEFPAIVDSNFIILDGQHRYEACRSLQLPFIFRFADKLSIDNVQQVQLNAGWSPLDYVHSYIQQGKKEYVILQRFVNRYSIPVTTAVLLLSGQKTESSTLKKGGEFNNFYSGVFEVTDEENAHKILKAAHLFGDMGFKAFKNRSFLLALKYIMKLPQYNQKQMMERMAKYGNSILTHQISKNLYIRNLEELYNYHSALENRVRFI